MGPQCLTQRRGNSLPACSAFMPCSRPRGNPYLTYIKPVRLRGKLSRPNMGNISLLKSERRKVHRLLKLLSAKVSEQRRPLLLGWTAGSQRNSNSSLRQRGDNGAGSSNCRSRLERACPAITTSQTRLSRKPTKSREGFHQRGRRQEWPP